MSKEGTHPRLSGMNHSLSSTDAALACGRSLLDDGVVRLRPLHDEDLPQLVQWWQQSDTAPLQQLLVKPQPHEAVTDMFRSWSKNAGGNTDAGFSIVRSDSGELLGHTTLYGAHPVVRASTFAIVLGPEFSGQGLGPRVTRLVVSYGFRALGLNKISLGVWAYNTRAIAAYKKAGFVEEGRRRAMTVQNGRFHDEVLMGILAEEFFDKEERGRTENA